MQLEIPPVVSHIYQDQVAKSFNILSECVRNCIDFNQFSKMTLKHLMNTVQDNFSARCSFYFTLPNRYTYFTSPIFVITILFYLSCIFNFISKQMYFFQVEITYLNFYLEDMFLRRCILQMKSHLMEMQNKAIITIVITI